MPFSTPNMSLTVWLAGSDPYEHDQLADNFLKLDQHAHAQGQGAAIGRDGLADSAVVAVSAPLGSMVDWYTPNNTLPAGWARCNGTVVAAADHQMPGVTGTFTTPTVAGAATNFVKIMKVKYA